MARESWILVGGQAYTPEELSAAGYGTPHWDQSLLPKRDETALAALQSASEDNNEKKTPSYMIRADLLIPGEGEPIKNAALVYRPDEAIEWVGEYGKLPSKYHGAVKQTARVKILMPGLWDCHVHLTGSPTVVLDELLFLNQALAGARLSRDMAALLNAGYTSVRELAGHGWAIRKAVQEGWVPGPNIYSSVSMLSTTAGHGDCHMYPLELMDKAMREENVFALCDGVDACVKAVRHKIRQGADLIKIAASGGVISRQDDPKLQQFSDEEMAAMVKEATKFGRIVTAHCHGKDGIMGALNAGCLGIEHGTWLDDEAIDLMKKKGAMLVATRSIANFGTEHPEAVPPDVYRKMVQVNETHKAAYAHAVRAGVVCALGTDMGVSSEKIPHNHGNNSREIVFAVEAGMTPAEAIRAATVHGPWTLGKARAPKSGKLEAGYDADFIAVTMNPLDNVKVLLDTDNITHVWKTGKLYKSPGNPVGLFPIIKGE